MKVAMKAFSTLALVVVLFVFLAGCASVGNPALKTLTIQELDGKTYQQLVAKLGPPNSVIRISTNGVAQEHYTWAYAYVGLGAVESATLTVSFDADGKVLTLDVAQLHGQ